MSQWKDDWIILSSNHSENDRLPKDELFKVVFGAVKNTINEHPDMLLKDAHMSIAKRITGLLAMRVRMIDENEEDSDSEELSGQQGDAMSELP